MAKTLRSWTTALCLLAPLPAAAQSAQNLTALKGLAPVSALGASETGRAALDANLTVTGAIQAGTGAVPFLLPLSDQRQLALRDSFITDGNATELADGLGSKLATSTRPRPLRRGRDLHQRGAVRRRSPRLHQPRRQVRLERGQVFLRERHHHGKAPVSEAAAAILTERGGTTDVFGKAYGRPAGHRGAMSTAMPARSRPCRACSPIAAGTTSIGRPTAWTGCAARA